MNKRSCKHYLHLFTGSIQVPFADESPNGSAHMFSPYYSEVYSEYGCLYYDIHKTKDRKNSIKRSCKQLLSFLQVR